MGFIYRTSTDLFQSYLDDTGQIKLISDFDALSLPVPFFARTIPELMNKQALNAKVKSLRIAYHPDRFEREDERRVKKAKAELCTKRIDEAYQAYLNPNTLENGYDSTEDLNQGLSKKLQSRRDPYIAFQKLLEAYQAFALLLPAYQQHQETYDSIFLVLAGGFFFYHFFFFLNVLTLVHLAAHAYLALNAMLNLMERWFYAERCMDALFGMGLHVLNAGFWLALNLFIPFLPVLFDIDLQLPFLVGCVLGVGITLVNEKINFFNEDLMVAVIDTYAKQFSTPERVAGYVSEAEPVGASCDFIEHQRYDLSKAQYDALESSEEGLGQRTLATLQHIAKDLRDIHDPDLFCRFFTYEGRKTQALINTARDLKAGVSLEKPAFKSRFFSPGSPSSNEEEEVQVMGSSLNSLD